MEVFEANTLVMKPVHVRRFEQGMPVPPDVAVALVIGQNEDDVRRAFLFGAGQDSGAGGEQRKLTKAGTHFGILPYGRRGAASQA